MGAEWVSAPLDTKSMPRSAMACTLCASMLPEHSVFARPSMNATAFAMASWSMLSSMMMSALAAIASSTCVNVSHSTSISRTNGAWARAASMASRTPPAAAMWLSFSSTPSERL